MYALVILSMPILLFLNHVLKEMISILTYRGECKYIYYAIFVCIVYGKCMHVQSLDHLPIFLLYNVL